MPLYCKNRKQSRPGRQIRRSFLDERHQPTARDAVERRSAIILDGRLDTPSAGQPPPERILRQTAFQRLVP